MTDTPEPYTQWKGQGICVDASGFSEDEETNSLDAAERDVLDKFMRMFVLSGGAMLGATLVVLFGPEKYEVIFAVVFGFAALKAWGKWGASHG